MVKLVGGFNRPIYLKKYAQVKLVKPQGSG